MAGGATTEKEGAIDPLECKCSNQTYLSLTPAREVWCMTCPLGARCPADQRCALRAGSSGVCSNGDTIVGVWEIDISTGTYALRSCPAGYALINTLDSLYTEPFSGDFNHDVQRCQPCDTKFEYIFNYTGNCEECPRCVYNMAMTLMYLCASKSPFTTQITVRSVPGMGMTLIYLCASK